MFMSLPTGIFFIIVVFQWGIIYHLVVMQRQNGENLAALGQNNGGLSPYLFKSSSHFPSNSKPKYEGVAVTLMVSMPKWFQRRYTTMIQNVLDNTPSSWAVQVFYIPDGKSQSGLDRNPGIMRMKDRDMHGRIILTPVPEYLVKEFGMTRKKLYWTSEWIWRSMVADSVLVFSGNGALCSNSKLSMLDGSAMKVLERFDYIGTGQFIDGSFSFRNRTAMLDAIHFSPHDGNSADDYYFIETLKAMNKKAMASKNTSTNDGNSKQQENNIELLSQHQYVYRLATEDDTNLISGINETNFREEDGPPMIISGTLPHLTNENRNLILEMCPEIKGIFPSLHNPACFGAHPDSEGCAKSICAMNPTDHPDGC